MQQAVMTVQMRLLKSQNGSEHAALTPLIRTMMFPGCRSVCTKLSANNILRYVSTPRETIWVLKGLGSLMYFATLSPAHEGAKLGLQRLAVLGFYLYLD